jgi:hypothetical protein
VQVIADPGPWTPSNSSNTTENGTQSPVVVFTKPINPILVDRANRARGKVFLLPITEDVIGSTTKTESESAKTTEAVTEPEEAVSEVETLKDLDSKAPISLGVNNPTLEAEESIDVEKEGKNKDSEEKSDFPIAFKSMPLSPKLAKVIGADKGAIIGKIIILYFLFFSSGFFSKISPSLKIIWIGRAKRVSTVPVRFALPTT